MLFQELNNTKNSSADDRYQLKSSVTSDAFTYERAIQKLNALQSNAVTILKSVEQGPESHVAQIRKVESTTKYLSRIGISLDDVDRLSVIHVAGTKGKGTTAALCESILRKHGYRTGFYSSPHLVAVRERIRINGVPLSQKKFVDYFENVYSRLDKLKENETDMPAYFKFLTVMAFHVFLHETVDVAIVEVGIGGEYDCTNCIRKPLVAAVTTLGLDHTKILGSTLPDIAWQKSGIFKVGCHAFTVPQASPAAMDILRDRAENRQCSLAIAPPIESYTWEMPTSNFAQVIEDVYTTNASLALQISNKWLQLQSPFTEDGEYNIENNTVPFAKPFHVTEKMMSGIMECSWPGRTQIIPRGNITYFLDGAHTEESINYCLQWFNSSSSSVQVEPERPRRVLLFNITGQRKAEPFLRLLLGGDFNVAVFSAIVAFPSQDESSDLFSVRDSVNENTSTLQNLSNTWQNLKAANHAKVFCNVSDALKSIADDSQGEPCHVLITGSMHLVGAALSVLDPTLDEPSIRVPAKLKPLQSFYGNVQAIL